MKPPPAHTLTSTRGLPILSWNIHDKMTNQEGSKTGDPDFSGVLSKSMIFCLQETKQEFFLPNYQCFNKNRADSRSGGVCIGVHRSISNTVKAIETKCPDFQAVTVYPDNADLKFTIIHVYDSPENSSYKAKARQTSLCSSTLELLLEFRANHPDLGDILLLGDLNARTAN